jgi:signal transduction histidine kinase
MLRAEKVNEADLANQFGTVSSLLDQMRANQVLPDMKALVRDGLYGIAQISELVNNLRNFARLDRSKLAEFNLNDGIASALMIAKNVVKHKTIKRDLGAIPNVICSPSQINQVLLNLITNAAQATRDDASGVITIRSSVRGENQVVVEVEDNGHGIPEEVIPKIFDPFFTTRDVGQGTGLGLSIVYKIVEQHGGRISVISKVGVGTRFTVQLPVVAASGESASSSVMAAA